MFCQKIACRVGKKTCRTKNDLPLALVAAKKLKLSYQRMGVYTKMIGFSYHRNLKTPFQQPMLGVSPLITPTMPPYSIPFRILDLGPYVVMIFPVSGRESLSSGRMFHFYTADNDFDLNTGAITRPIQVPGPECKAPKPTVNPVHFHPYHLTPYPQLT